MRSRRIEMQDKPIHKKRFSTDQVQLVVCDSRQGSGLVGSMQNINVA